MGGKEGKLFREIFTQNCLSESGFLVPGYNIDNILLKCTFTIPAYSNEFLINMKILSKDANLRYFR